MGQVTVPGNNTVPVFTLPAGLCNVTMYNINTAATTYVGTSTAVTSTNGLACHSVPTSFFSYVSSGGATFYATTGNATASSINYIIVTDQKLCPELTSRPGARVSLTGTGSTWP